MFLKFPKFMFCPFKPKLNSTVQTSKAVFKKNVNENVSTIHQTYKLTMNQSAVSLGFLAQLKLITLIKLKFKIR